MKRWQKLAAPEAQALLLDEQTERTMQAYQKNIEYFIGTVKLPVGIAGPLRALTALMRKGTIWFRWPPQKRR